eukprot:symbB.v1.2.034939.t1/scaffold4602.1/size37518/3
MADTHGEKDWLPPVGDWLAQNVGTPLLELPETLVEKPEEKREGPSGDQSLAEMSAARVQQMMNRRQRSLSRPSSNRGLAPPPIPSGSSSAAVSDLALWIWGF